MHLISRPRFARYAREIAIAGLLIMPGAIAAQPEPPRAYTRYVFTPFKPAADERLELEYLEAFVVLGRPREPAFVRAKSRVRIADRWVDLEPGEQELRYYTSGEYERVRDAIEAQADYFGDLVGVKPPAAPVVSIVPDAVIAASWFENMERAARQTQRPGPNVFVISEVSLVSTREDFVRALNPQPVNVIWRLLRWDSSAPRRFERLERVITGYVKPEPLAPEDRRAIHVHLAGPACAGELLN